MREPLTWSEVIGSKSKGRVVVREKYLRQDISCRSHLCQQCDQSLPALLSSCPPMAGYLIPDSACILHFLEIFEIAEMNNIIILESVMKEVKCVASSKLLTRVKSLLHNPQKCAIFFSNETSEATHTPRHKSPQGTDTQTILVPEPISVWRRRAMLRTANWYRDHLGGGPQTPEIFVIHADTIGAKDNTENGVKETNLRDFVAKYLVPQHADAMALYESLEQVRQEQEEQQKTGSRERLEEQFAEHLPSDAVIAGLKSGVFYRGKLQVSSRAPQEATVQLTEEAASSVPGGEIFISSHQWRNRAIHGDDVAIELLPRNQWTRPSRSIRSDSEKADESQVLDTTDDAIEPNVPADDSEVPTTSTSSGAAHNDVPCGRVVAIIQRNWRAYAGTLQESDNLDARKLLAVPIDIRIPKIRITTRQGAELLGQRLLLRIDDWGRNSQYPNGHFVSILGPVGDIDAETKVLMVENDINLERRFSPGCMAHLPAHESEWKVTEADEKERRDLRDRLIMSIDPPGCEDIDDALSLYRVPSTSKGRELLEIGVHIADVTHFVPHDSLLDREARERGTTVYLADRRMDMLPFILSGQLCSLREQTDRFAMSVLWTIDAKTFEVVDVWYGKTIIFSSHEFSYQTAHAIINDQLNSAQRKALSNKTGRKNEYDLIRQSLLTMLSVARQYRCARQAKGALELHSTEVKFEMTEQKTPSGIRTKQTLEVMKMVEEFMILANQAVAERIYRFFPTCALLRRHPHPRECDFSALIDAATSMGFSVDVSSNRALAQSLNECILEGDEHVNQILRMLATQAMSEAKYMATGDFEEDEFYHYGLAAEYYTHFTSPIRRYADVIVHRLLSESIQKEQAEQPALYRSLLTQAQVAEICRHINVCNRNAKLASMDSTKLFHSLYFKAEQENQKGRGLVAEGIVFALRRNGFIVYVPEYGIKGPVYLQDGDGHSLIPPDGIQSKQAKYKNVELTGSFQYDQTYDHILLDCTQGKIMVTRFSHCSVEVTVRESSIRWPSIVLRLKTVNTEAPRKALAAPIKRSELSQRTRDATSSAEQRLQTGRSEDEKHTAVAEQHRKRYQQTPDKESDYMLFEHFRALTIK